MRELRGIGRYVRNLLPRLVRLGPDVHLTAFLRYREDAAPAAELLAALGVPPDRFRIARMADVRRHRLDLLWYPWNVARRAPPPGPVAVTIHDVVPLLFRDMRWRRWMLRRQVEGRFRAIARRADLVLTNSQFTASELTRVLGVPPARIRVTLLGADDLGSSPDPVGDAALLQRLGLEGRPFFLAVGADEPRKNLDRLREAFAAVSAHRPDAALVLCGPGHELAERAAAAGQGRVVCPGYVDDRDLAALYRGAVGLVFPSLYEGFGLPVLEAMAAGTPVVCSTAASLPEVAGDAALLVDPTDTGGLAAAMRRLLAEPALRADLVARGRRRAAAFRWDDTARATLAAFAELLGR